jgi:Peptidase A4 family
MGPRGWGAVVALTFAITGILATSGGAVAVPAATTATATATSRAPNVGGGTFPGGLTPHLAGGPSPTVSGNWSGYADTTTSTFTDVKGTWTEPSAVCPSKKHPYSSFWVGLDGFTNATVEQLGTDSDCDGKNKPAYDAWFEMYPGASEVLPDAYPVRPGDTMSAEVKYTGGSQPYTLSMTDMGKWNFTTTQPAGSPAPTRQSAEWIAEAPSSCRAKCKVLPLADFQAVSFSGASVDGNPISSGTDYEITMVKGKNTRAFPSALSGAGTSFSVTWMHS